mmetsp:Transcript_4072/g.5353  ORF Transcript_4072/g.5353 Transcript_4072/m.5353 type:complete len:136 (+) Transcript_4072:147-554(+)|eukprot:CAMPEP_0198138640 /NCGR_PEP_ID=MMETSP1443-20131203/2033_1 /TAXON_ID=186043 /ORGANISM="Entomoneis sp., Strain CCMP2396" /LENGTH=135 /DNA_ID=CAMNT_0043800503 /DNA_START=101 /DNA_END=511 /DNA_ORIENTATION=+
MATRGIVQLQKLKLMYCEHGGSSRAIRDFISSDLVPWANAHPSTEIQVIPRNGNHPYVQGEYLTKVTQHQVCVKNLTVEDVQEVCDMLANRSGRKITKIVTPVLTDTPSCQGIWTPFLNLQHEEPFKVTIQQSNK